MSVQHLLADAYGLTFDRLWATTAALVALVAAVLSGLALARSARRADARRTGARVAIGAGLLAVVNGVLVVVTADGGPGTGNGIVGGCGALVLGLVAAVLGVLALTRSRATAAS